MQQLYRKKEIVSKLLKDNIVIDSFTNNVMAASQTGNDMDRDLKSRVQSREKKQLLRRAK